MHTLSLSLSLFSPPLFSRQIIKILRQSYNNNLYPVPVYNHCYLRACKTDPFQQKVFFFLFFFRAKFIVDNYKYIHILAYTCTRIETPVYREEQFDLNAVIVYTPPFFPNLFNRMLTIASAIHFSRGFTQRHLERPRTRMLFSSLANNGSFFFSFFSFKYQYSFKYSSKYEIYVNCKN